MVDLLIFGGQSNMQGQTEALRSATPVARATEYRYLTDTQKPLCNPCGEDIRADGTAGYPYSNAVSNTWHADNILGSACDGNTTLLPAFCRAYLANSDAESVVAVHAAKGSTDVLYWMPGTDGYRVLSDKVRAAIANIGRENIRRIAFMWLQGESDAIESRKKDAYKSCLAALGAALADDLSVDTFGVIRVGYFTNDARDEEIIAAQDEICAEHALFAMLTTKTADFCRDPAYADMMNPFVGGHYSAKGLEELGTLAGTALAAHYNNQ